MLDIGEINNILKDRLTPKRYTHSLGVQQTSIKLASLYKASVDKASIAALIHDCAKNMNARELLEYIRKFNMNLDEISAVQTHLLHGQVGAELARVEFEIHDEDILNAIRYHTTGRRNMSVLEKIIYLADFIEPNRDFPGVEKLREISSVDLDKATLMALEHSIEYIISKGEPLHLDTIHARNYFVLHMNAREVKK